LFQSHNGAIAAVTVAGDSQSRRWFQSHNGAIAARGWLVKEEEDWRFNPTMVRLLLGDRICEFCVVVRFNPTMVRLLPSLSPVAVERVFGFNPTMVRLLPDKKKDSAFAAKVSIPQWCDCCSLYSTVPFLELKFQSHNGAIAAFALYSATRTSA